MTALRQEDWYDNRYSAGGKTPVGRNWQTVYPGGETQDAAIRFIQSQIGGLLAILAAESVQSVELIDF